MKPEDLQESMNYLDKDVTAGAKKKKHPVAWISSISAVVAAVLVAVLVIPAFIAEKPVTPLSGDGVIGSNPSAGKSGGIISAISDLFVGDGIIAKSSAEYSISEKPEPMPERARDAASDVAPGRSVDEQFQAGTLTAGEWRDRDNLADWAELLSQQNWLDYMKTRGIYAVNPIVITVVDADGYPCYNVPVTLKKGSAALYTARTDVYGKAYLFASLKDKDATADSVELGGVTTSLDGQTALTLTAPKTQAVTELDFMLMVDTTGSMGDELYYLQTELADIVRKVGSANQALSIRVSVNFYRDEGDEYIVKYYDFRTDINEAVKLIKEQESAGGGDWPEAVHTALENAVTGHTWRDNAVKLCFFVLDAPAHSEQNVTASLVSAVTKAAELGIRIVPVLCSCGETETECFCRSLALLTGGTYVFLTDDSGYGGEHLEPTVGEYTVEKLNDCIIRITKEYCGISAQ